MNNLNLSENLLRLRRERKITQEELADFIGVTKAAVSKWENRQSVPDLLLLPQLASFFGVTVDELIGYEAQMSKEQIRRCYAELCRDFAERPFQEVLEKTRTLVRRYYSCYPFLLQVCVLYLNHFMLAGSEEACRALLKETEELCERIIRRCSDVSICSDAIAFQAILKIQQGEAAKAVEILEPITDPGRLSDQNDDLLIQAYQLAGETEKARSLAQIRLYIHLVSLVSIAIQYLELFKNEPERCEETIRRTEGLLDLYQGEALHPNLASQFHYQAAVVYGENGKQELALRELSAFAEGVERILHGDLILHGDRYFDRLEEWIEKLPLGDQMPRDKSFIGQNVRAALAHPAFSTIKETEEYRKIYERIVGGDYHG